MNGDVGDSYFLLVQARMWICAFAAESVIEVMRPLPIEPVRGAPPFVLGVAMIRNSVTPVVALDTLLGANESTPPQRFVLVHAGSRRLALAVESIRGVEKLTPSQLESASPLLSEVLPDHAARLGTLDRSVLVILEAGRLMTEETWSAVLPEARVS